MKIAMTYDNEEIFPHFGKSPYVVIYEVEGKDVLSKNIMKLEGSGHGRISAYLKTVDVNVLICGRMGEHAKQAMDDLQIKVYAGVSGRCDDALHNYLQGTLKTDSQAIHPCCH